MSKEIKFSLVYRDMWQSSGKYQPRIDQLVKIAPVFIEMGCFARVETNGGAFEQVNLLYGENPNKAIRAYTKILHKGGIQTHMLDRGLNGLRMYPVPVDVRKLMYRVKHAQGVDIPRIFDGLNDTRNIIPSIQYAKEAGMTPQATLCITYSPVHTIEYYAEVADQLIAAGAPEICMKDMAGIGRPVFLGNLVRKIKSKHPTIIIQYHGHTGPGLSMASVLEVCKAGADIIDVAIEPLSWGKIHPDVISVRAMLADAGFDVPEINMNAYMKARAMTQEFIDDFLGLFINPTNSLMSSLLLTCGLPGGMMGSMMADLEGMHGAINAALRKNDKKELTMEELTLELFNEVEYVWPKLGYPPLVTPFSQYVKNIALMNVFSLASGEERFSRIDPNAWGMILGKSGKLPGTLAPEILALAKEKKFEFTTKDPQTFYPDNLEEYRKEMDDNGWAYGDDEEELFELAMHDRQYRDYKSGVAKQRFEEECDTMRAQKMAKEGFSDEDIQKAKCANAQPIEATVHGKMIWEFNSTDPSTAPELGHHVNEGDIFCYINTSWNTLDAQYANFSGRIVEICKNQGDIVAKGDPIAWIKFDAPDGPAVVAPAAPLQAQSKVENKTIKHLR
ncbi:MAG: oxaloacetate decarboxylase [Bacteroidaceae bacterium]